MKNTEKLIAIDGIFDPGEAAEVLLNLLKSKINFHKIKNWSSQERFGKDDETAQKRIPELQKEVEKLQVVLGQAQAQNKKLAVRSEINITLLD